MYDFNNQSECDALSIEHVNSIGDHRGNPVHENRSLT